MNANDIDHDDDNCSNVDLYAVIEGRVTPKPPRDFDSDNEDDEKEAMRIRSQIRRANNTQRMAHQLGASFPSVDKPKPRTSSNVTTNSPKSELNTPGRTLTTNQQNQVRASGPPVPDIIQTNRSQNTTSRPKLTVGHDVNVTNRNRETRPGVPNVTRPKPEMLHEIKEKEQQMDRGDKHIQRAVRPEMLRAIREKAQHLGSGPVSEVSSPRSETMVHESQDKTLKVDPLTMTSMHMSSNRNEFKEKGQHFETTRPNYPAVVTRPKSAAMVHERQLKEQSIGANNSRMDPLRCNSLHDRKPPAQRRCHEKSTNRRTLARSVSPTWEDRCAFEGSRTLDSSSGRSNVRSDENIDESLRSEKRKLCDASGGTKSIVAARYSHTTPIQSNGQLKPHPCSEQSKGIRTNGPQWDAGRSPTRVTANGNSNCTANYR